jgi:hypothetical protein
MARLSLADESLFVDGTFGLIGMLFRELFDWIVDGRSALPSLLIRSAEQTRMGQSPEESLRSRTPTRYYATAISLIRFFFAYAVESKP